MTSFKGQLTTVEAVCTFLFAGNATITLRSLKTGARFTYKVEESDDGHCHFVSLLTGDDNEGSFNYLGHFRGGVYSHGRKSKISAEAPSAKAFAWFAAKILRSQLPAGLEIWHCGRCGHCGRKLTVPESVATGFGPDCSEKLGIMRCELVEPAQKVEAPRLPPVVEPAQPARIEPDAKTGMFLPSPEWLRARNAWIIKAAATRRR